ncbi:unnamed protein product [Linum tenue]|uniref:BSD domain-containing protein n=1 Tax=Linum tenue TaxID=586396 RepID=A0AAV0L7T1_9ROSI|nr:unnamed protein product [Linum tenue]
MSWLARSIANTLQLDDDDADGNEDQHNRKAGESAKDSESSPTAESDQHSPSSTISSTTPRGVKEDISELTKTLSRQFWGVASFLAPPPESPTPPTPPPARDQISDESIEEAENRQLLDPEETNEALIEGIRSDFAEIGGRFKSGISKLSTNKAVSEITKIASNFLQFAAEGDVNDEDLIGSAIGVTEDAVAFARDVSMHPETWLDFPIPEDDDFEDFDMSEPQQEHALTVERLAPRLAALRIELCPGYMSEGCFWKIYFVLLHPRLSKEDALLLSTPQIMEARAMLSHELQKRAKAKPSSSFSERSASVISKEDGGNSSQEVSLSVPSQLEFGSRNAPVTEVPYSDVGGEAEKEKHPVQSIEIEIVDKAVVVEEETVLPQNNKQQPNPSTSSPSPTAVNDKYEDDGDDWLKDESSEMVAGGASGTVKHIEDDEDVSFSDLEDDDEGEVPVTYKKVTTSDGSAKDSRDWVELISGSSDSVKDISPVDAKSGGPGQASSRPSENREANDWLDVEDIDVI